MPGLGANYISNSRMNSCSKNRCDPSLCLQSFLWGGIGFLETSNSDGKKTSYLETAPGYGSGKLSTYNKHEVMTGYFGTDKDNDGKAVLSDRY